MVETTGLLLLSAAGITDSFIGIGTASSLSVAGVTVSISTAATIAGTLALTGAAIGLQYALDHPDVPKPENGAQPLKQALPSRQRGYGTNRLAGYYMLFLAAGGNSQDVLAFHSGRIEGALQLYFHDSIVALDAALDDGVAANVVGPGVWARDSVVQIFYGSDTQNAGTGSAVNSGTTAGEWTSEYQGKGTACICLLCPAADDPTDFTHKYPRGIPLPSVVAKCAPIWDPRDDSSNQSKTNPVLQLIDYLTEPDGGMGEDRDIILPPAALTQWMEEAEICDEDVGGRPRFASNGFYRFDNSPENVINKILATCDGWLVEGGDGTLVLKVGVYREPTDPPLTSRHIKEFSWRKGLPDEEQVNKLDITFTDPASGYITGQIDSVRDEDAISASGIERAKQLDLTWVQDGDQAESLGQRAMLRINPEISGTFSCSLYAMRYLGKRWIKVQEPRIKGMEDCVVEIQDKGEIDLLNGRVTLNWNKIDPVALGALDNAPPPIMAREGFTAYQREDSSYLLREQ
ncbi:hypothetical protein ABIA95_000166 [Bradyrhizobium sp. LA8.1]|uniref:phage tail protein n=1 Tax=unclassified Bradyrhizobium TaxID=2631580 RepID=UPI003390EF4C